MVTPTPATQLVQLSHVSKSFGPVQVLKDVSLEMIQGEVLCLAGENGAGKSTLIKILTGAIPRDSGKYHIDGQDVGVEPLARGLRRGKPAHGATTKRQGDRQQTRITRQCDEDA